MQRESLLEQLRAALRDGYAVETEIGAGGMATVFLAQDLKHGRQVAIKVLDPDLAQAVDAERFLREVNTAANLIHPHILPVHDSGVAHGLLYYVMPCVAGGSLRERLIRDRQLSVDEAVRIAGEVADALASMHRHGVVHRDIKPENILLDEGHAWVADLGIATALRGRESDRLTTPGFWLGTPAYTSPEQIDETIDADGRADIYALACVLYEMLIGEPPFTGPNAQVILARHAAAPVPPITAVRSGVPRPLVAAIEKALSKSPADRFSSADVFRNALFDQAIEVQEGSVAVLPFANLSADPDSEYFSDGITEEILNALSGIPHLRVPARTSSFIFKGQNPDIQEVGARLHVANVLEGSVRRAGDQLRITTRLVNVADGYHLWSERYDRKMDDVFAIQDEIAAAVAKRLKTSLTGTPTHGPKAAHTKDLEAYELYLRGRYFWNQRGPGLQKARECFEEAVQRDPRYALAHAGMADALAMVAFWSVTERHDAYGKAKEAARRALELDPSLAEPHACLGFIAAWHDWDWRRADREFLRAIELKPRYVEAHLWYGQYTAYMKQDWAAALARVRHGHTIDPLSMMTLFHTGAVLIYSGSPEEGLLEIERTLELAPHFWYAHLYKGVACRLMARYTEASRAVERSIALSGGHPFAMRELALTHFGAGRLEDAHACLEDKSFDTAPFSAAWVYAAMGERVRALDLLEQAYEQRDPLLPCLRCVPELDLYQDDPRYREVVRRLRLP